MIQPAPPPASPVSDRSEWLQDTNAFLVSALLHLVVLVILGLIVLTPRANFAGISLMAQLGDGRDAFSGDEGAEGLDEADAEFSTPSLDELLQSQAVDVASVEPVAVNADSETYVDRMMDDASAARALDKALEEMIGGGGGGKGRFGRGPNAVSGDGNPFGREDGFFGLGSEGKALVYVVDCSDSMNDNGKWDMARKELVRALEELHYDQRYFVIFFSDGAYPMDADAPIAATYEEVDKTNRWVKRIMPDGGTNPLPALLYALSLEPDAVYFLSDGQFDPMVIPELQVQNPKSAGQVPIHTISFFNRETIGLMRTIARQSGGKFRHVE